MVTFALDDDGGPATNGTPRARPPLPFAKRTFGASPFSKGPSKHLGTPQSVPRKFLSTHNENASSLNRNTIATARNIFQASAISESPPSGMFSPNLPQSAMKRVFAPGATPEPSRVYRESTASAAPRGMAAKTTDKELFQMRISSPPRELSGEVLAQKVPKDWNSKGSIYADQFLSHLCPPDLDEEQRRQFFCILDLRRLKYAANEIFARKDWKLNVINFAKEFEKSRSIILLRYGLYEFQNIKPSKDVLKRWRREHGLPEPEDEEEPAAAATPSKSVPSKKRKADDDLTKDTTGVAVQGVGKRQTTDKVGQEEPASIATPQPAGKNKRKASTGEEDQPLKRSTPSATKALFEKITNKPAEAATSKPTLFGNKPAAGGLARSVFTNLKAAAGQAPPSATPTGSSNIFGYLSDASSAKNSGADADAESDSESDSDESPGAGESGVPSEEASAVEDAPASAVAANSTRESTPGRSLFERLTKGSDGEPVRAAESTPSPSDMAAQADKTWNPSNTPLKFAPSATQAGNLFGASQAPNTSNPFGAKPAASSNLFGASKVSDSTDRPATPASVSDLFSAPKPSDSAQKSTLPATTSSLFGAQKVSESTEKSASPAFGASGIFAPKSTASPNIFGVAKPPSDKPAADAANDGGESDKENDSQLAKKPGFEFKPSESSSTSGLFSGKPTTTSGETPAEPAKPTSESPAGLFGVSTKPAASALFGSTTKTSAPTPVAQSSTLFGAKPTEPAKPVPDTPAGTSGSLFGAQSAAATANLFGGAPAAASKPLFGATAPKAEVPAAAPIFSFGGNSTSASQPAAEKPLFAPKSPPAKTESGALFGSPMKQDEQSPAKKIFSGGSTSAPGSFTFGAASAVPSVNLFGGAVGNNTASGNTTVSFGATPAVPPAANNGSSSFGFSFGAGSSSAGTSFNNPFSSGNNAATASNGGTPFNFGGAAPAASGSSATFQFGGSAPNGGGSLFGGSNQASSSSTPLFGGAPAGGAPGFNFTAASPAQPQGGSNMFGSGQALPAFGNLQPPAGGSSTTGTSKSQFPNRKIAPLKRRL